MLKLNLPDFDYLIKKDEKKLFIYDIIRKKYVRLNPEEWVRQHFVNYLINYLQVPATLIRLEGGLKYYELLKRSDILVFSNKGTPLLLVECKSGSQPINNNVLFQIGIYNSKIKAPFLASTNGITHYYWKVEKDREYKLLDNLPNYREMIELSEN